MKNNLGDTTVVNKKKEYNNIAVICVGNKLMLDDGIGPAVYEEITNQYNIPNDVDFFDLGCMSLDMLSMIDKYDYFISVDAVDGTNCEPGTIFHYNPRDIARNKKYSLSLHDITLADLFDTAELMGYRLDGICFGMQVENPSPVEYTIGLTPKVYDNLPRLIECVVNELSLKGFPLELKTIN